MNKQTKYNDTTQQSTGSKATRQSAIGNNYIFRLAEIEEVKEIFDLYVERVHWMNERGIIGWNTTDYLQIYPQSYYRKQCQLRTLYVLRNIDENLLAGAVVLLPNDERWQDKTEDSAYYIHNLVSRITDKGAGEQIIERLEKIAIEHNKHFLRLDCAVNNLFLNEYYASKGYEENGRCKDGVYSGIRREKKLFP